MHICYSRCTAFHWKRAQDMFLSISMWLHISKWFSFKHVNMCQCARSRELKPMTTTSCCRNTPSSMRGICPMMSIRQLQSWEESSENCAVTGGSTLAREMNPCNVVQTWTHISTGFLWCYGPPFYAFTWWGDTLRACQLWVNVSNREVDVHFEEICEEQCISWRFHGRGQHCRWMLDVLL
jgi:hypothetical protein